MDCLELEELAVAVINLDRDEDEQLDLDDIDDNILSEIMYDTFGLKDGIVGFEKIVSKLIQFTPIIETALTKTKYHAFIKDNLILCREEVK